MLQSSTAPSSSALPRVRTAIIGGGPCGLGAAWRLEEIARQGSDSYESDSSSPLVDDWILLESAPAAGGLAGSVVDPQGFTSV